MKGSRVDIRLPSASTAISNSKAVKPPSLPMANCDEVTISYSMEETEEPEDMPDDGTYCDEMSVSYSNEETEESGDTPDYGTYWD